MRYLHTMVRVKDLAESLDFYCNKLGLAEVRRMDSEAGRFTLVYLAAALDRQSAAANDAPLLELTYNWDPENYSGGRNFGIWRSKWTTSTQFAKNWRTKALPSIGRRATAIWLSFVRRTKFPSNCCKKARRWHRKSLGLYGEYRRLVRHSALLPLSLYIHFPWCIRKCPYCDFNSHAVKEPIPEQLYIDALLADLRSDLSLLPTPRQIGSIFMGGGTPSLFSPDALSRLFAGITQMVELAADCEITLEANPGTSRAPNLPNSALWASIACPSASRVFRIGICKSWGGCIPPMKPLRRRRLQ